MDPRTLIELMKTPARLKDMTRHSWTRQGRHESVAQHTFSLALLAYFVKDEFPNLDIDRVIRMCLFHDMGEAFTGDIPAFEKTDEHEREEERAVDGWIDSLPEGFRQEVRVLFDEMNAQQTGEAKLYKALDKMETLMQHNEADISTWLALERELNFVYGEEQVRFSPYLEALRQEICRDSRRKIEE